MNNRSNKLFKNSIILFIGNFLTKGLNFIMAPLFTRWLSINDYGTFDLLTTYSMLLIPIVAMGIHHAIFRFLLDDTSHDNVSKVITNALIINVFGFIIYILVMIVLLGLNFIRIKFLFLLSMLFITQSYHNFIGMYLRGIKKIKFYTITNILLTVQIFLYVIIFVYFLKLGLNGMVLGYSLAYVLSSIMGVRLSNEKKILNFNNINYPFMKEMLKYSLPMIPNTISWWIVTISDRTIVSLVIGMSANAILSVANKIPNLCATIYDVFQTSWMENASESINDKDFDEYFQKVLNIMIIFSITISTLIISSNYLLFKLLFTEEYYSGIQLVPILAISIMFSVTSQTLGSVFIAEYNSKLQGKTMVIAGFINIVIHITFIKFIELYAAALSTLISYIFLFLYRYYKIKKNHKIFIRKKTIYSFFIMLVSTIVCYVDIGIFNHIMFLFSIIIFIILNRELINRLLELVINRFK